MFALVHVSYSVTPIPTRPMNRKEFIESQGASCRNWTWSWSFLNEDKRFVIFGAWDIHHSGTMALILSESWQISRRGRRQPAYPQSREHIRLVEEEGFRLFTFPMVYSDAKDPDGVGPATIGDFTPRLTEQTLLHIGDSWYATDGLPTDHLPEEVTEPETHIEGAARRIEVNAYERNPKARAACLKHHGFNCCVCGFNFEDTYGPLGKSYMHVHHLIPLSEMKAPREVDPVKDLVPICPNCHAMVHKTFPALAVESLREVFRASSKSGAA